MSADTCLGDACHCASGVHAAAHYGVQAVGITLRVAQAERARQRLLESGLNDRCRVEVSDYRDIDHGQHYDKLASVGMFEHVSEAFFVGPPTYVSLRWPDEGMVQEKREEEHAGTLKAAA